MKQILMAVLSLLLLPVYAQDAATEPRATKGGTVSVQFKNIPSEDINNVNGDYAVSREDGTISMPYLSGRVSVVGLTSRQVENKLRGLYLAQEIYSDPIVMANVGPKGEAAIDTRYIQVTGYVAGKKNLPYREGMTLVQALIECGDITDFGSRKIQVTRGKVTRTYDYFSARDRAIKLLPNDSIFVPRRPAFEGRPDKIGP
ncbi:MAG: polysaccharide biosynthesis/export family protein [Akkermansia sp.]|nr:polysaccharide biosynthesis/export family protein [Akkermansia sp.]